MKESACVYCGSKNADTRDHVPPKSVLIKPFPNNLITIPACRDCNSSFGFNSDVNLRIYLSLLLSNQENVHVLKFRKNAKKSIKEYPKLAAKYSKTLNRISPDKFMFTLTKELRLEHIEAITRIVRGLFYYVYGRVIPDDYDIEVYDQMKYPMDSIFSKIGVCPKKISIDDNVFYVLYEEVVGKEGVSMWEMYFYQSYVVRAVTGHSNDLLTD